MSDTSQTPSQLSPCTTALFLALPSTSTSILLYRCISTSIRPLSCAATSIPPLLCNTTYSQHLACTTIYIQPLLFSNLSSACNTTLNQTLPATQPRFNLSSAHQSPQSSPMWDILSKLLPGTTTSIHSLPCTTCAVPIREERYCRNEAPTSNTAALYHVKK